MPRKTHKVRFPFVVSRGFNEAAARCRGKPTTAAVEACAGLWASMRPRPDAAENRGAGVFPGNPGARLQ